jgi:predicted AlkP superfamily phosphohydrolase/phosphomutase
MQPRLVCIGVDGLSYKHVMAQLRYLPTFHRLFRMGCGGSLSVGQPVVTCEAWLEFLTGSTRESRAAWSSRRKRTALLWNHLAGAGVTVAAVNVPLPVEAGPIEGTFEPRPCPFLLRETCSRPEDVLMQAEDSFREAVDICQRQAPDLLLFGLPPADLIGRGPRSERETFLVAHKSVDSIVGRMINALDPSYVVVFSPFATERGTKTKPGQASEEDALWVINGNDVVAGERISARLVDLLPTMLNLLDILIPSEPCMDGESLYETIHGELAAAKA